MLKLYNTCILPIFLYGSAGMDTGRVDPRVGSGRNFWNALFFISLSVDLSKFNYFIAHAHQHHKSL